MLHPLQSHFSPGPIPDCNSPLSPFNLRFTVSLPKLKDFEWRIDIKTASDQLARMSMPTAIVQMKVGYCCCPTDDVIEPRCF